MVRVACRTVMVAGLVVAASAACKHRRESPASSVARDAAVDAALRYERPATPASAPARPRPFVVGQVVIAAERDGQVRPLRLDPATGSWQALGSGPDHLFPTEAHDGAAVLVVVSRGEEDAHVEQLAWVRGAEVAPFGPQAGAIRNPAWSAAGEVAIFESSARSFRDLYRVGRAGAAVQLTDDREGNLEPALSPDGRDLVFTSSRDGDAELYRMPSGGGRATRLTASAKDDWGARWSPDGRRLVFLSDREGPPRAFVMDADGTDLRRLTDETDPDVTEDQPRWSPDGATVAILRGRPGRAELTLVDVARRRARGLTPPEARDGDLAWSPDGAYLLVARHQPITAAAIVAFVRVADSAVVATDTIAPLALRWYP
jgi:TolB protein